MDEDREAQAVVDFQREAALAQRRRPRRLPPGNRSVKAILALERELNVGLQLSVLETDWQFERRVYGR